MSSSTTESTSTNSTTDTTSASDDTTPVGALVWNATFDEWQLTLQTGTKPFVTINFKKAEYRSAKKNEHCLLLFANDGPSIAQFYTPEFCKIFWANYCKAVEELGQARNNDLRFMAIDTKEQ